METSLQLSLALAGIAATLFGVGITLIVQWSALPKKNQLRNLAFWSAIVLFILALPLLLKAIYAGWGSRDVIEVIVGIALGIGIALIKEWVQKRRALRAAPAKK